MGTAHRLHPLFAQVGYEKYRNLVTSDPFEVRLDPLGLFSRLAFVSIRQLFWQYATLNLLLVEYEGERGLYQYVPNGDGLHQLLVLRPGTTSRRDLSAVLGGELGSALARAPGPTLSLLDVLARATDQPGGGSGYLALPKVEFGSTAIERMGATSHEACPPRLSEELSSRPSGRWTEADGEHWLGLAFHHTHLDGTSGGYRSNVVRSSLLLTGQSWLYRRQVVWEFEEPGIELS